MLGLLVNNEIRIEYEEGVTIEEFRRYVPERFDRILAERAHSVALLECPKSQKDPAGPPVSPRSAWEMTPGEATR